MKRTMSLAASLALAVAFALALPAAAGDAPKKIEMAGWITDEWCGAKNAKAEGAACAKACAKKGAALVFFSDGKTFKLSDQKLALEHVGHEVVVRGTLQEDGTIEVSSIEKAEKKA